MNGGMLRRLGTGVLIFLMVWLLQTGVSALSQQGYTGSKEDADMIEYPIGKGANAEKGTVRIKLHKTKLNMHPGDVQSIPWTVWYRGSPNTLYTSSANQSVAKSYFIGSNLCVCAVAPGKTKIYMKSGSKKASCTVIVHAISPESVQLSQESAEIALGSSLKLYATVLPSEASQQVKWSSSDEKIAKVMDGVVYGNKEGIARITAKTGNGKSASCIVTITQGGAPQTNAGKALLIGMSLEKIIGEYDLGALPSIPYELKSVQAMFTARGIAASQVLNASKAQVTASIRAAFSGRDQTSVNYVYFTSHGGVDGSNAMIFCASDAYFTAAELRALFDSLPGTYVLMLNECESGGAIGKGTRRFAERLTSVFAAKSKLSELAAPKYQVICSAKNGESAIIWGSSESPQTAEDLFAYALLDAVGWRLHAGETFAWNADKNNDGSVSMEELSVYLPALVDMRNRMYAERYGETYNPQTVVTYSANSGFVVFKK